MDTREPHTSKPLDRYLSVIDVWAMAFGCMVGWGVFAMPGTTFLPVAGPLGICPYSVWAYSSKTKKAGPSPCKKSRSGLLLTEELFQ